MTHNQLNKAYEKTRKVLQHKMMLYLEMCEEERKNLRDTYNNIRNNKNTWKTK